jgi:hypothetical protein
MNNKQADNFVLPDSLFAMQNLISTAALSNIYYDSLGNVYADSTKKIRFKELSGDQVMSFLQGIDFDSSYLRYTKAHFIARQNPIGDYTPIVVLVNADDYSALQFVLLDKYFKPVAHYCLHGGFCAGPEADDGKIMEYCPEKQSVINGDEIRSYVLHIFVSDDTTVSPATIDSINYMSKVVPTGKIETRQVDSVSYKRLIGNGEFRDL